MVKPKNRARKSTGGSRNANAGDEPAGDDNRMAAAAAAGDPSEESRRGTRRSPRRPNAASEAAAASSSKKRKRTASKSAGTSASTKKSRRASSSSARPPPAAAAGNGNDGDSPPDALATLSRMLIEAAPQEALREGGQGTVPVDAEKAANILEATAGNVRLAVSLYWDDYFASHYRNEDPQQGEMAAAAAAAPEDAAAADEDRKPPARRRKKRHKRETRQRADDDDAPHQQQEEQKAEDDPLVDTDESSSEERRSERKRLVRAMDGPSRRESSRLLRAAAAAAGNRARRLRRSLDPDFRAADRPRRRRREDPDGEYDEGEYGQNDPQEEDGMDMEEQVNDEDLHLIRERDAEASTNVSDDDGPRRGRFACSGMRRASASTRHHEAEMRRRVKEAAEEISKTVLKHLGAPEEEKRRKVDDDESVDDGDDLDDWIDDRDWLQDEADTSPSFSLWGNGKGFQPGASEAGGDENANSSNNNNASGRVRNDDRHEDAANNAVGMEDDEEGSNTNEDGTHQAGIPHTWLNAGFQLSDCGTGLVVRTPKVEDIDFLAWRQHSASRRNEAPPPFHCKALTSILSVITALLYSGASIQGNTVNCKSGKKPWATLTLEDKKREYEGRLADAISSLLFVAAQSSIERKHRALRKHKKKLNHNRDGPAAQDIVKEKKMEARLNLVATCVWEEDLASLTPRTLDGPPYRSVHVKTSWTNIQDISLYAMSNAAAFTSKGGVALLLETLIRIHGSQWMTGQIRKARSQQQPAGTVPHGAIRNLSRCLLQCTCEDRQKKLLGGKPLSLKIRNDPEKIIGLLTPAGNGCMSVELLSLILSGKVSSDWKDCNVSGLGIGLLTDNIGEVSYSLARPERPVWILRGEACYSVAFIEDGKDFDIQGASKLDKPMSTMQFCHWNAWYGETNKTEFRVITGASNEPLPRSKKQQKLVDLQRDRQFSTQRQEKATLERMIGKQVDAVSIEQHEFIKRNELENMIQPSELRRLMIHPEDQKLYPNKRHMWRYDTGRDEKIMSDKENPLANWVAYHRLNAREKRIVEIKLGPKISKILWTRWPTATIANFTADPVV
ncbi:MAG: hypothetical protein SGILL_005562 [Bacillariaceae sp.]